MKAFNNIVTGLILIYFAVVLIGLSKYDDSDDVYAEKRSGMIPKTDYKTGCQYLQSRFGFSITPRMGANGKQLGCKEQS